MKIKITIFFLLCAIIMSCGSKKNTSDTRIKEKTDIELTDDSQINTKVESEKQYTNTKTNERIVTFYGVRFDTIQVDGKPVIVPLYYPERKEENRDISVDNFLWRISIQDSIQKAVQLEFKGKLEKKEKEISELKESTQIYQIALLLFAVAGIIVLVLYIKRR